MTLLTCVAVRRRLAAYHDRELPVPELISIEAHVKDCLECGRDLRDLQEIGDALRMAAAPGPADDWTGLAPGVISRMRAEANESWSARAERLFEDLHLVWIGFASTAATFLCGGVVLGMMYFASPEAPPGSDLNPMTLNNSMQLPSLPRSGGLVGDTLESRTSDQDLELTLQAVVTKEGRVEGLSVLTGNQNRQPVNDILKAISEGRLEPAQFAGAPVAVNLVWLVAQTTVRGKAS
jgi:hypothetical protein